jgi:DNA polymerase (family 10)
MDLPDVHARRAADLGIPIAVSTDAHSLTELDHMALGITNARRAWIGPGQVLNTRPVDDVLAWTRRE